MPLESTLFTFLKAHSDKHLLVAYSGGIDSQVLLHALSNLKSRANNSHFHINNPISALHINHGLSENAFNWEVFAQQTCDSLNIPLATCRVHLDIQSQQSIEELARDARYDAIKSYIEKQKLMNVLVLTGHHSDDQTETFLLALKRGSGLKGLSAMKQEIGFNHDVLARPLLSLSRAQIESYASMHKLNWIEDESNEDVRFDRNFIRHQVMPAISKRWPSFLKTLNRSAEHCQEADLLLTELAQQDLSNIQVENLILSLPKLKHLSKARFNNVLRYFLSVNECLMPSKAQLTQLQKQLFANDDKSPAVKLGTHWLRRFKQCVYLTRDFKDVSSYNVFVEFDVNTKINKVISLPDEIGKLCFNTSTHGGKEDATSCQIITPLYNEKLSIRFVHKNPTCTPDYRKHSRSLKKILQELNIPSWQRKRLPLIYYNEQLVAVLGHFVCKGFIPSDTQDSLSIKWSPNL